MSTATPLHSIDEFRRGYEEEKRLRGFRSACGFVTATWVLRCPRCGENDLVETSLSGRGSIAAFSIQHVPSDEFLNDAPYAYVVVDLEDGGRITGWMEQVRDDSELSIGDPVHWVESYKPGIHFAKGAAERPPESPG